MGNKILLKKYLNEDHSSYEMHIEAPLIAKKARGGNFVILRLNEKGERFPLTIADYDREKGAIILVVAAIGKSTLELANFEPGDEILDLIGPLGKEAPLKKYDDPVLLVGGGVGIAAIYPQAKELKEMGNIVISILGARTKSLLFWEDKFRAISDEVIITTDDGSYGKKGLVTERMKEVMREKKISHVIGIGPLIMMKFVALTTTGKNNDGLPEIPTTVSLNPIMVDGTGMCGGCRFLTNTGETLFACVDGPDVDGHNVDWKNLMQRNSRFKKVEQKEYEEYKHECRAVKKFEKEQIA